MGNEEGLNNYRFRLTHHDQTLLSLYSPYYVITSRTKNIKHWTITPSKCSRKQTKTVITIDKVFSFEISLQIYFYSIICRGQSLRNAGITSNSFIFCECI